jgi:prolipoprotein diacylglyceryltransferase
MPSLYTTIGPWTLQTFTWLVAAAVLVSLALARRQSRGAVGIDTLLAALVGAVIGARALHVGLRWDYFQAALAEAANLAAGGMSWHGAVLGGLFGLAAMRQIERRRGVSVSFSAALDALALALPLIGLASWTGCIAAGCGWGREVDTLATAPAWLVWESIDVYGIPAPRFSTQRFGIVLCGVVLLILVVLYGRRLGEGRRFWIGLALLSLGMFVIGFFRADPVAFLFGLRADQGLDVALLLMSLWAARRRNAFSRTVSTPQHHAP